MGGRKKNRYGLTRTTLTRVKRQAAVTVPTGGVLLGVVSVMLASYGCDQTVPGPRHQRRPPTSGHVRGLKDKEIEPAQRHVDRKKGRSHFEGKLSILLHAQVAGYLPGAVAA